MLISKKNNLIKDFLDGIREIIIFNSGKMFMDKYDFINQKQLIPQKNIGILNSAPKIIFEGIAFLIILLVIFLSIKSNQDMNELLIKLEFL